MCEFHVLFFFLKRWVEAEVLGVEEDLINFCVVMFHREHWWFFFFFFPVSWSGGFMNSQSFFFFFLNSHS